MKAKAVFSIKEAYIWGLTVAWKNIWLSLILTFIATIVPVSHELSKWYIDYLYSKPVAPAHESLPASNDPNMSADKEKAGELMAQLRHIEESMKRSQETMESVRIRGYLLALINFLFALLQAILPIIIWAAFIRLSLLMYAKKKVTLFSLFIDNPLEYVYLFIASLLYSTLFLLGLLLLIVPGIIWSVSYRFFGVILVETECGPIQALRRSRLLTQGHRWHLFKFIYLGIAISWITWGIIAGIVSFISYNAWGIIFPRSVWLSFATNISLLSSILVPAGVYVFKKLQEYKRIAPEKEYVPPIMTS